MIVPNSNMLLNFSYYPIEKRSKTFKRFLENLIFENLSSEQFQKKKNNSKISGIGRMRKKRFRKQLMLIWIPVPKHTFTLKSPCLFLQKFQTTDSTTHVNEFQLGEIVYADGETGND